MTSIGAVHQRDDLRRVASLAGTKARKSSPTRLFPFLLRRFSPCYVEFDSLFRTESVRAETVAFSGR
jgi:hypothetical protein